MMEEGRSPCPNTWKSSRVLLQEGCSDPGARAAPPLRSPGPPHPHALAPDSQRVPTKLKAQLDEYTHTAGEIGASITFCNVQKAVTPRAGLNVGGRYLDPHGHAAGPTQYARHMSSAMHH